MATRQACRLFSFFLSLSSTRVWVETLCYCDNVIPCQFKIKKISGCTKQRCDNAHRAIKRLDFHTPCFLCQSSRRFGSVVKCHYAFTRSVDDAAENCCLTRAIFAARQKKEHEN